MEFLQICPLLTVASRLWRNSLSLPRGDPQGNLFNLMAGWWFFAHFSLYFCSAWMSPIAIQRNLSGVWLTCDKSVLPEAQSCWLQRCRWVGPMLCPAWVPWDMVFYPLFGVRAQLHIQNLEPAAGFWRLSIPDRQRKSMSFPKSLNLLPNARMLKVF